MQRANRRPYRHGPARAYAPGKVWGAAMKTTRLFGAAFAVLLLVSAGCGGGNDVMEPLGTQLAVVSDIADPAAQEETSFTLTASNAQLNLKKVSMDFDGDGNWDQDQLIDAPSINTKFRYTY